MEKNAERTTENEDRIMSGIRIFYAYDAKIGNDNQIEEKELCKALFSDIFKRLKHKFEGIDEEFAASEEFGQAKWKEDFDLIVGDPVFLKEKEGTRVFTHPVPAILFLGDDVWGSEVGEVLGSSSFDIRGIFLASRLLPGEERDIEDFASLFVIMKNFVRQVLRTRLKDGRPTLHEEELSKRINWKVTVQSRKNSGFISLFSDPSMQSMAREYKDALRSLKSPLLDELREKEELTWSALERPKEGIDNRLRQFYEKMDVSLRNLEKDHSRCDEIKRIRERGMRIPSLLLLGETGCGKSLLARASAGILSNDEFFRANIAAYPENSIDGFLFGAAEGSYTGSNGDSPGAFIAHCGETVFLDEIGDMNADSQTRLLTYMDDGKVTPLGMSSPVFAPCVLIAATNKPVDSKDSSDFRQDIVHRFDHIIKIPSLRDRKQDLRLLISLTLQDEAVNPFLPGGKPARRVDRISLDVIKHLEAYDFPGNYRELEFILRQAVNRAFAEGSPCICVRHIIPTH